MSEDRELSIGKISELTTGSSGDFKEKVNEMDLTLNDLRALKEAESSGKNRDDVLEFIDRQITEENVSAYLGLADNDVGELSDLINEIERVEDIEHFDEENIDIDQDKLIDLVGGTVDELKAFVNDNPLTAEQLENVLNAEQRVKDRKTAKSFLEKKIQKRQVGQDMKKAHEDLEELKQDLSKVREDEGLEIKDENEQSDEDGSGESESEEGSKDDDTEESGDDEVEEKEDSQDNDEEDGQEENDEEGEVEQSEEDEDEKESEEHESEEQEEPEEDEASNSEKKEEDEDEQSDEERKRELANELELEMSDEELENFSVEDLEKIKSEKEHREDLIEKLAGQGMEEEELRNSSTEDLEKIAQSIDEQEESKEEHEEMREEAEEDLEMLMGAVRWDEESEEEDSGKSTKEKIEDLKSNIRDKLSRSNGGGEESPGINADRVSEILDQYRELDDEEASIKTAHIMKGFLERTLELEREMTYKELAETMPTEDESMKSLAEFFLKLNREQYTGKFDVNDSNEIIDTCEEVIQKMS